MVRIVQINLGRRKGAAIELNTQINRGGIDIALIQEPFTVKNRVRNLQGGIILYNSKLEERPRSCIWMSTKLFKESNCIQLLENSDRDQTAVRMKLKMADGGKKELVMCSIYFPGIPESMKIINDCFSKLVARCKTENLELIVGCDANAHHSLWGSKKICKRGEELLDYITSNNLQILNVGNEPTFVSGERMDVIDLTISTLQISRRIENWRVEKGDSFSDHKAIGLEIRTAKLKPVKFRNKKKTDWEGYRASLKRYLSTPLRVIDSKEKLDAAAKNLTKSITKAYHDNCKLITNKRKCVLEWQNSKLLEQRKHLRKAFNKAYRSGDPEKRELYKKERNAYRADCDKAISESWKKKVNEIENIKDCARLQKILESKGNSRMGSLKRCDGTYTSSVEENAMEMLTTHFPQCEIIETNHDDEVMEAFPEESAPEDDDIIMKITTMEKIKWAIASFSPFKAAGEDEIFPALLQKAVDILEQRLQILFRHSLRLGYIPSSWRGTLVVFIPKVGKPSYDNAKAYRPISLMSFILKTLEKLIDRHIRNNEMIDKSFHPKQFAYQEGKGTETALHNLVTKLDLTYARKEISLAVFIDIEGAFDNTSFDVIERAAKNMSISNVAVKWIKSMLKNRRIRATADGSSIQIKPTKGCPQGGCLSPLLWCLVVDSLIKELEEMRCHVTAYADDLALVIAGKDIGTICDLMNSAMKKVESWCTRNGLHVNPSKTSMMRFTNLRSENKIKMKSIKLFGENLKLVDEFKYLGVYLDPKLSMNRHVEEATAKGLRSLWAAKAMVSRTWGLSPHMAMWLYKQVILPRMTYGSVVWWHKVKIKKNASSLNSVQRLAMLMITGCMRTTPTLALNIALNLSPFEIKCQTIATESYRRLKLNETWERMASQTGHGEIESISRMTQETDKSRKIWNFGRKYHTVIDERCSWNVGIRDIAMPLIWYSDGSKRNGKTASGIYCPLLGVSKSYRISDHSTVMQAEMIGVMKCAEESLRRDIKHKNIVILTDSQAVINALEKSTIESKTTKECVTKLNSIGADNWITIGWVPGHSDILGNEIADKLANEGIDKENIDVDVPLPNSDAEATILEKENKLVRDMWRVQTTMAHSRMMMKEPDKNRSNTLLKLSRKNLRVAIGVLTGHCCLRKFLSRIGKSDTDRCRFCDSPGENMSHVLKECPTLLAIRMNIFGKAFPEDADLRKASISQLLEFARKTNIYETFFKD